MTVLGIDLSLTSTGLAVAEQGRIVSTYVIKSSGKKGDGLTEMNRRISEIVAGIRSIVDRTGPKFAVLEAPSFGSKFGSPDERAGLRWRVINLLVVRQIPIAEVSPRSRAKYGTGNGNSKKPEVHAAVKANYATANLPIKTNDEADAVILAAMGARHLGQPVELVLPDGALESMEKVAWPR